jgi:hypothetical protein
LACGDLTLAGDTTKGEDNDGGQDAEDDDNDEEFDQGEATLDFSSFAATLQPCVRANHVLPFHRWNTEAPIYSPAGIRTSQGLIIFYDSN